MKIFILLLLPLTLHASSNWKVDIQELMNGTDKEQEIKNRLLADKELDALLIKEIEQNWKDEKLALEAIRILKKTSLAPVLGHKFSKLSTDGMNWDFYFLTLVSLSNIDDKKTIYNDLKKKVDISSKKISASAKITMLSLMQQNKDIPSPQLLLSFLEDKNYELRLAAMDIVQDNYSVAPKNYLDFFHRALKLSPYTLRIQALESIQQLPKDLRANFLNEVKKCIVSDQNHKVKKLCREIQF